MQESMILNGLNANVNIKVNTLGTTIRGEVQPFISSFQAVKFTMEVKKNGKNSSTITSSVQISGTYGGPELKQYLRAIEAANDFVQEMECFARNAEDHSNTIQAITRALDAKRFDYAHTLVALTSHVFNPLGDKCNWNYSNPKRAFCLFDAIVSHNSFKAVIASMEVHKTLCDQENYNAITDEVETLNSISRMLVDKVGVLSSGNEAKQTLCIVKMVHAGKSIMDFKDCDKTKAELKTNVEAMDSLKAN
jgi:uncharacterized protein YerC